MEAIKSLKNKFGGSDLFGVEKDASFHSSIGQGITACYRRLS